MMYAWPMCQDDKGDLSKRIRADEHPHETAKCPLHGCVVASKLVNGVWQWVHTGKRGVK